MRRVGLFAASLLAASSFFACGGDDAADPAPGGSTGTDTSGLTTFHADVAPIFRKHCESCHHGAGEGGDAKGGLGPFSLIDYGTAFARQGTILSAVKAKTMPPWGAHDTDECKPPLPWQADLRMSDAEIATIEKWVKDGAKEGDKAKAPALQQFPSESLAGKTHTIGASQPYVVQPATGQDEMRCFVLDPGFAEDTWVSAVRVAADNPKVTHHMVAYVDPKRNGEKLAKVGESYTCFGGSGLDDTDLFAAWAPGAMPVDLQDDAAIKVPKGSLIIMQMHYHPTADTAEPDSTKLELRVMSKKPAYQAQVALIGNATGEPDFPVKLLPGEADPTTGPAFVIPPNASKHKEEMTFTFDESILPKGFEIKLWSVGTHMHWVGRDMKISLERGEPKTGEAKDQCLLQTPAWDFNWQRGYAYEAESFSKLPGIRAGDTLRMRCSFDNTMDNPYLKRALEQQHLTAPVEVKLGEQTLDEMCLGAFVFVYPAL